MTLTASADISFQDAIAFSQNLITQLDNLDEAEIETSVSSLVATENGARGFFVTYLTDDNPIVDRQSTGIIDGLKTSPEIVSELLVKNVAMSTGMKIAHHRNNDEEMANKSARVTQRSKELIDKLNLAQTETKTQKLQETIEQGEGEYQKFLKRWQYDDEQKKAIAQAFKNQ